MARVSSRQFVGLEDYTDHDWKLTLMSPVIDNNYGEAVLSLIAIHFVN